MYSVHVIAHGMILRWYSLETIPSMKFAQCNINSELKASSCLNYSFMRISAISPPVYNMPILTEYHMYMYMYLYVMPTWNPADIDTLGNSLYSKLSVIYLQWESIISTLM